MHLAEHRRRRRSFACHRCGIVVKCPDAGVAALDTRSDQSDRGGAVHVVWSACGGPREVGCEEQRSGPPADAFQILEPEGAKDPYRPHRGLHARQALLLGAQLPSRPRVVL